MNGKEKKEALEDVRLGNIDWEVDGAEAVSIMNHNFGITIDLDHFLNSAEKNTGGVVARHRGYAIGFFFYKKIRDSLIVTWFTITESNQGLGVEEMLADAVIREAEKKGIRTIVAYIHAQEKCLTQMLEERLFSETGASLEKCQGGEYATVRFEYKTTLRNRLTRYFEEIGFKP